MGALAWGSTSAGGLRRFDLARHARVGHEDVERPRIRLAVLKEAQALVLHDGDLEAQALVGDLPIGITTRPVLGIQALANPDERLPVALARMLDEVRGDDAFDRVHGFVDPSGELGEDAV